MNKYISPSWIQHEVRPGNVAYKQNMRREGKLLYDVMADAIGYTSISIKVASEKNDAWCMFHSPRCINIIVASLVNYVPATSLETKKANAANPSILCQKNVKTMYFKTLNPKLFNLS